MLPAYDTVCLSLVLEFWKCFVFNEYVLLVFHFVYSAEHRFRNVLLMQIDVLQKATDVKQGVGSHIHAARTSIIFVLQPMLSTESGEYFQRSHLEDGHHITMFRLFSNVETAPLSLRLSYGSELVSCKNNQLFSIISQK